MQGACVPYIQTNEDMNFSILWINAAKNVINTIIQNNPIRLYVHIYEINIY